MVRSRIHSKKLHPLTLQPNRTMKTTDIDHDGTDNLVCPYCGYEHTDSWEIEDDEGERSCDDCQKEFTYQREVTTTYASEKMLCDDDKHEYEIEAHFCSKNEFGVELPELQWKHFRIEVCKNCDDKEYVPCSVGEYDKSTNKF